MCKITNETRKRMYSPHPPSSSCVSFYFPVLPLYASTPITNMNVLLQESTGRNWTQALLPWSFSSTFFLRDEELWHLKLLHLYGNDLIVLVSLRLIECLLVNENSCWKWEQKPFTESFIPEFQSWFPCVEYNEFQLKIGTEALHWFISQFHFHILPLRDSKTVSEHIHGEEALHWIVLFVVYCFHIPPQSNSRQLTWFAPGFLVSNEILAELLCLELM